MGHVTRLPAAIHMSAAAYPHACTDLNTAECTLLLATRWWVNAFREKEDALFRLCLGLERAGAYEAAFPIDTLMGVIVRTARRTLTVQCPRWPSVSDDEKHLLHVAALAQNGDSELAARVLRVTLLSAAGAEDALIPLETIGALFARVRLIFRTPAEAATAKRAGRPPERTIH
jgi:hypothetical protein